MISTLLLFAAAGFTIYLRLRWFPRPIWLDEAWVANSVLADSVQGMLHYEHWQQSTPPLMLLATRFAVHLFGLSEASLKLVPILAGCLTPILALVLARRVLTPPFQLLFVATLALRWDLILQSQQVKHYAGDTAVALLLLILAWRYLEAPSRMNFIFLTAAFTILPAFSYPAVCPGPVALAVLAWKPYPEPGQPGPGGRWRRASTFLAFVVPAGILLYVLQIHPNRTPGLVGYWASNMPGWSSPGTMIEFFKRATTDLFRAFPPLPGWESSYVLYAASAAFGLIACAAGINRNRLVARFLLAACALPVLTTAALSLLRLYPYGADRPSAFLFPSFYLLIVVGLESIWQIPLARIVSHRWRAAYVAAGLAFVLYTIRPLLTNIAHATRNYRVHREDMRSAIAAIRANAGAEDLVYVNPSAAMQANLYLEINRWHPRHYVIGAGSWPCCVLGQEYIMRSPGVEALLQDFQAAMQTTESNRAWIVYTTRGEHWRFTGLNEPAAIFEALPSIGCRVVQHFDYPGICVTEVLCEGAS